MGFEIVLDEATMLSLLEGCDMAENVDAIPSVVIDSLPSSQCGLKPATSTDKRSSRSSWRDQRRNELQTLQQAEKQLITQLQQLKQTLRMKSRNSGTKSQLTSLLDGNPNHVLTWERICDHQLARRKKSEEENRKLKEQMKAKIWQAKMLLKGFKRRLRNEVVGSSIKLCRRYGVDASGVTMPTNNDAVFYALMLGTDEMYAVVDDFFEKMGMDEVPCPGRRNIAASDGKFVEFLDCYAVPFGLQDTARAIWKCLHMVEPQSPKPAQHFDDQDNTFKQSMCSAFAAGSVHVRVIMRIVGRKYVERNRAIFIFKRLIEPVADVPISFQETTRIIVRPGTPSDTGPTTLMQSHRQSTTSHDPYALAARSVPQTFIDMGIAAWENSITRFNNFVEDTLIQEPI
ncbi:Hypothetical protein PHPALM_8658 [Phytophthora palmivora]|uniref:M96 mating-specific protein family n=1 Tax=Phytophthora palmivora TaxID=4796 RepID=A0A2P4Y9A8_9STRA|nr:Hypothetical protein PHPALM_8658 [Phytophthora palmivora]